MTQNRDGGMKEWRNTEQDTAGMECALSLFRFQVTWQQTLPSQSLWSQIPKHLGDSCRRLDCDSRAWNIH